MSLQNVHGKWLSPNTRWNQQIILCNFFIGDELILSNGMTVVNYFIEVVPTTVRTFMNTISTYQYSVKELTRPINHDKGSHGIPGIYFKYDMSALRVTVSQERDHLGMFLARLCSIVGGVYVCSGKITFYINYFYWKNGTKIL